MKEEIYSCEIFKITQVKKKSLHFCALIYCFFFLNNLSLESIYLVSTLLMFAVSAVFPCWKTEEIGSKVCYSLLCVEVN